MKKILLIFCVFQCLSCKKDAPIAKGGSSVSSTVSFTIKGQLIEDCSSKNAPNRHLEYVLWKQLDSVKTTTVGQDGKFELTYSDVFAAGQPIESNTTSPLLLRVLEDSVTYILPATINFTNLILNLKDSINFKVKIAIDSANRLLFAAKDSMICSFGYYYSKPFSVSSRTIGKFGLRNDTLSFIKERPKIIRIDKLGKPIYTFSWSFVYADGSASESTGDYVIANKASCIFQTDSVLLKIKR